MLKHAFKEWAVICKSLAEGRQSIIVRKGGIAETDGTFQLEQQRFWLYPTYTHQQQTGIQPEARELLDQVEAERPPAGRVRLSHFAEVDGIYHVKALLPAQLLAHLHIWSEDTVAQRFAYRQPGLYVLAVRVYRVPTATELPELASYQGCRSWVELAQALPTQGAVPVLTAQALQDVHQSLDLLLNPSALA